jgi:hypothetical protein
LLLDVDVRLAGALRIRNSRATLDVLGTMTASGTLAQPTATGQVSLREGGTLTLSRARVRVSQGLVELNGYPGGNPELDFAGTTRVGGVGIEVAARGTFEDLQLTLSSTDRPDLSQTDLVTLLLTGRTASAVASQGGAIVAEELAAALGGVLQKGVGERILIDVSPDRSLLADDTDPTQRFNVGTRLAEDVFVVYSAALDGTEQRFILDFNPGGGRFRFRGIDEEDQSFSFEATDRVSFDLWNRGRRGRGAGGGRRGREAERLTGLRIEGELPVGEAELRQAAKVRVGRRQSALQREEAAERVRAALVKRGFPGASVETESVPTAPGAVELVLKVTPGPSVVTRWSGDDVGARARREAEAAWPPYASPEVAAAAVARAARVPLQAEGYHAAEVSTEVRVEEGEVELTLRVARGVRGRGVRLEFDGNTAIDDRALAAALPSPGSREFFEALDGRGTRLTNPLRLAYARAGYVDARVLPPRVSVDEASGEMVVALRVRERQVSRVIGVELPAEIAAAGAAGPVLSVREGALFDVAAYVADRDAIGAWYRREGWPDSRVAGFLDPGPGGVGVRFAARPGPRPRVGEVRVVPGRRVNERMVTRAVTLGPGDLVRPRELSESRERLSELGLFRSIDVRAEPREGEPEVRDVVVSLAGRPDVTVEYGLRYSTSGSGGIGVAPSSPAGGRLQARRRHRALEPVQPGMAAARLLSPHLGAADPRRGPGLGHVLRPARAQPGPRLRRPRRRHRGHDARQPREGGDLPAVARAAAGPDRPALARPPAPAVGLHVQGHQYTPRPAERRLPRRQPRVPQPVADRRRARQPDRPGRGAFWTATTELARGFLGSDADYVRLYGQGFLYVPLLGRGLVWAQGYRAGVVPGEDPLLLLENRFRAGGPTTVRGFEQNALGPLTEEGRLARRAGGGRLQPGAALPGLEDREGRRLLGRRERVGALPGLRPRRPAPERGGRSAGDVPVRPDPPRVRLGPRPPAGRAEGPLRLRPRPRLLRFCGVRS